MTRQEQEADIIKEETIADEVKQIISEQLTVDLEEITNDSSFTEDLGADSLDTVSIVMEFEDKFNIEISDEDAEKIATVGEAIEAIKQLLAEKKKRKRRL